MSNIDDMFSPTTTDEITVNVESDQGMEHQLKEIWDFVVEMKSTSKSNDKLDILETHKNSESIKTALLYALDPFRKYHVTPKNCIKNNDLCHSTHSCLWELLDDLSQRNLTGHDAIASVNGIIELYPDYEELIFSIINKNLKTRASETLVNKVLPKFIPSFKVALAHPFEPKRANWATEDWYGSRKLDGVRCLTIYDHDSQTVKMLSREGNEFLTTQKIKDDILNLGLAQSMVFDGEVCIIDENGLENFSAIMKEIKKKDHTIEDPRYVLFDCLTKEEFDNQTSERIFSVRLKELSETISELPQLSVLEQEVIRDDEHIAELIEDAEQKGFEGIMVRKDAKYIGKRSYDILKVKKFHDAEYEVLDIVSDVQRVLKDGNEVEEMLLAKAIISHKGNRVGVGSGWTQDQRRIYNATPELIIGRTITVQFFEETTTINDQGEEIYSLRFPVVKHIWDSVRDL